MSNSSDQQTTPVDEILGYGKVIEVLFKGEIRKIHLTPAPLKFINRVQVLVTNLIQEVQKNQWSDPAVKDAVELIFISTRQMHSDLTEAEIEGSFTLGALAKVLVVIMDMNHFLSNMQQIQGLQAKMTIPVAQ